MGLNFRPLCDGTARTTFICGDAEIDKWFRNKSLNDHTSYKHIVTCVREDGTEDVLGFYALSAVTENAKSLPSVSYFPFEPGLGFPCLQLVYLAVRNDRQNTGVGTTVMGDIIRSFARVGEIIGLPAMIVTPLNDDAARLYLRLGFEPYGKMKRLFMPLQVALEAVSQVESEEVPAGLGQ